MYFRQFLDDRLGCCSYLLASNITAEAAVIDPGYDISQYERILEERSLRLRYVIDTHVHADHISGARRLASAHGADLALHEDARAAYPFRRLRDGQELSLGQLRLRVLHTPGHRPELVSILVIDLERSIEGLYVLTRAAARRSPRGWSWSAPAPQTKTTLADRFVSCISPHP